MYPKILDLGPITIHTYGILLAAAFIAGIWLTSRNARKAGVSPDAVWSVGLAVIFSSLVGAKLLLLFSNFDYYSQNLREVFSLSTLRSSGVYYGGVLLGLGAAAWYVAKKRISPWIMADIAAPGLALGQAIARLGCLSAGCCYGKPTDLPWSIVYKDPYSYQNVGVPLGIPLHPTQLYEFVGGLCLFGFLMWRLSRKRITGQIILEYLALYAALRFVIEFFRDDARGFVLYGLLSVSQLIAILTMAGAAVAYAFILHRATRNQQP